AIQVVGDGDRARGAAHVDGGGHGHGGGVHHAHRAVAEVGDERQRARGGEGDGGRLGPHVRARGGGRGGGGEGGGLGRRCGLAGLAEHHEGGGVIGVDGHRDRHRAGREGDRADHRLAGGGHEGDQVGVRVHRGDDRVVGGDGDGGRTAGALEHQRVPGVRAAV